MIKNRNISGSLNFTESWKDDWSRETKEAHDRSCWRLDSFSMMKLRGGIDKNFRPKFSEFITKIKYWE